MNSYIFFPFASTFVVMTAQSYEKCLNTAQDNSRIKMWNEAKKR